MILLCRSVGSVSHKNNIKCKSKYISSKTHKSISMKPRRKLTERNLVLQFPQSSARERRVWWIGIQIVFTSGPLTPRRPARRQTWGHCQVLFCWVIVGQPEASGLCNYSTRTYLFGYTTSNTRSNMFMASNYGSPKCWFESREPNETVLDYVSWPHGYQCWFNLHYR